MERSRLILGCGNFGGVGSSPALRGRGENEAEALAVLEEARRRGLTRFDTANTYGGGESERILGDWLYRQDRAYRARCEISTKVGNPHGTAEGARPLARAEILRHIDLSLQRLRVECVDVYYLHEMDPRTPPDESLEALEIILRAGKAQSFGLSNAKLTDVKSFSSAMNSFLRPRFRSVQNEFSELVRGDEKDLLPFLREEGIGYVAFSPFAGGFLSGKYRPGREAASGSRLDVAPSYYERFRNPETSARIEAFLAEANRRQRTPLEHALARVLETRGIDAAIIGPRRPEHFV